MKITDTKLRLNFIEVAIIRWAVKKLRVIVSHPAFENVTYEKLDIIGLQDFGGKDVNGNYDITI